MRAIRTVLASFLLTGAIGLATVPAAGAAPVREGREWRELYETTGLSWAAVASVCPTDGVTPCSGSVGGRNLNGWVWATADQVRGLMDDYAPGLATSDVVSGIEGFWGAVGFLGEMRWTTYTSLTYFYSEWTGGWTASKDANGTPIAGGAGYSHALAGSTADGSIGLGSVPDEVNQYRGVFLWRTEGLDYTPPTVTPTVSGTLGLNGWYRSDVTVSWTVTDAESPIVSTVGCDPATLATDSAGSSYACTATSAGFGGPGTGSATVKRDATPPTVTCDAAPTFTLGSVGGIVTATVTDSLSGAAFTPVFDEVNTATAGTRSVSLTGSDRAGNTTTRNCSYTVVAPACQGKTVTKFGTSGNDVINGTAGVDVIHGLSGNDTISGLGKGDVICGGDGWDTIYGGAGVDLVDGGAGNDDIYGGDAADDLNGGADSDAIRGDAGADRCTSGEIRMSSCAVIY